MDDLSSIFDIFVKIDLFEISLEGKAKFQRIIRKFEALLKQLDD